MREKINSGFIPPANDNYAVLWSKFQTEHPDLYGLFSRMRVSFLVKKGGDDRFAVREAMAFSNVLERRMAYGVTQASTYELGDELGISEPAVVTLVNGALGYISQETGLPFNPSLGIVGRKHVGLVASRVHQQRALETKLETHHLSSIEEEVASMYLLGYTFASIAELVSQRLALQPAISKNTSMKVMRDLLGVQESRVAGVTYRKVLKARELAEAERNGKYHNRKAEATLEILDLLEEGYSRAKVIEEMSLGSYEYKVLLKEAFIDLRQDAIGSQELASLYREISHQPFQPLTSTQMNHIYRMMFQPYREFRLRLGDNLGGDGYLDHTRLSPREKAILEAISEGINRQILISRFGFQTGYWQALSKIMLQENWFLTRQQMIDERRLMLDNILDDMKTGPPTFAFMNGLNGVSADAILRYLVNGLTYKKVAEVISEQSVSIIGEGSVFSFYGRVRAHYRE